MNRPLIGSYSGMPVRCEMDGCRERPTTYITQGDLPTGDREGIALCRVHTPALLKVRLAQRKGKVGVALP